jgi:hypothetical protein
MMSIDSYGQFEREAEWEKGVSREEWEERLKKSVGPDEEIEVMGKAYDLYMVTERAKPMAFWQFVEINQPDEARIKSWVRLDKCMSIGRKLRMF